jgi:hypothetical protein
VQIRHHLDSCGYVERLPLARARGGASQEGMVSLLGAERMRSHFVVTVAMGPARPAGIGESGDASSISQLRNLLYTATTICQIEMVAGFTASMTTNTNPNRGSY